VSSSPIAFCGQAPPGAAESRARTASRALLPSWPLIVGLFAFARTVYALGGWSGLVLLTAACFAASASLLTRLLLRRADPFSAVTAALLGCAVALGHLLARPHLLALPLLVLWCGILIQARDDGKAPPLWLLPVIMLWANLHASFMFGLMLAGFLGGEAVLRPAPGVGRRGEARRWGLFVLLAGAAAVGTPNGIAGLIQPFRLVLMPVLQRDIIEWQSPDFQHALFLEIWLLGLVALGFTTGLRLPPTRLLLLLGLCHMTLQHVRYVDLLGFVAPLALAAPPGAAAGDHAGPGAGGADEPAPAAVAGPPRQRPGHPGRGLRRRQRNGTAA
jgi:hypothetical protein